MLSSLTPERWRQARALAEQALDEPALARADWLDAACGGDEEIREAVQRLLSRHTEDDDLPNQQALAAREDERQRGDRIGAYAIDRELGRGGMGRVYLAHRADDAFAKTVAIKLMRFPSEALEAAFRQERRILGLLEHAHIARLHDGGTTEDGALYAVMEYVDGAPLDAHTAGWPLERKLRLFVQVARAVGYAHRQGVVHGDLKPANILVNREDEPKILDFGISTLAGQRMSGSTPGYASPEQRTGAAADARSDIYSLGVLLAEWVTPPPEIQAVIERARRETPAERYDGADALANDIENFLAGQPVEAFGRGTPYRLWKRVQRHPALALVPVALAAAVVFWVTRPDPLPAVRQVRRLAEIPGREIQPNVSPRAGLVAFAGSAAGNFDVYVQAADHEEPRNLTAHPSDDTEPAIAPDERSIAFRSEREGGGIYVTPMEGGAARRVAAFGRHPAWSPDGRYLAVSTEPVGRLRTGMLRRGRLYVIDVRTGASRALTPESFHDATQPVWSPDGRRLAFWGADAVGLTHVYTVSVEGGAPEVLVSGSRDLLVSNPLWPRKGRYVYYAAEQAGARTLWRVATDGGSPERLDLPIAGLRFASLSRDGQRLVYTLENEAWNVSRLAFDAQRREVAPVAEPVTKGDRTFVRPRLSPDGRQVVFESTAHEGIWLADADGKNLRSIEGGRVAVSPRFVDDETIGYIDQAAESFQVVTVRLDGSGRRTWTTPGTEAITALDWFTPQRVLVACATQRRMYFQEFGRPAEAYPNPAPEKHTLALANTPPYGGRRLARLIPLLQRSAARVVLYDPRTRQMEELGANAQDALGLLGGERYLLYKDFKHVLHVLDRETRADRVIHRFRGDVRGITLSPDQRWLYFSQADATADVWVADMVRPL